MAVIFAQSFRFILFVLFQLFVFNQVELGFGIHLLMCPLYVFLLPFETTILVLLFVAFGMGFFVDVFSNTYGLHASSLVLMAYFRPYIFSLFAPRDEYSFLKNPTYLDMGHLWFFSSFGTLLLIHNTWFFLLESFSFRGLFYSGQKIILSFIVIYCLSLLIQRIMIRQTKK